MAAAAACRQVLVNLLCVYHNTEWFAIVLLGFLDNLH
jgi:hypothetical protein